MLAKLSRRRQFAIPKRLADELHLHEGDLLKITRKGYGFYVVPVELEERYPADLVRDAAQALEKNFVKGKSFKSFKGLMADLHKKKRPRRK